MANPWRPTRNGARGGLVNTLEPNAASLSITLSIPPPPCPSCQPLTLSLTWWVEVLQVQALVLEIEAMFCKCYNGPCNNTTARSPPKLRRRSRQGDARASKEQKIITQRVCYASQMREEKTTGTLRYQHVEERECTTAPALMGSQIVGITLRLVTTG